VRTIPPTTLRFAAAILATTFALTAAAQSADRGAAERLRTTMQEAVEQGPRRLILDARLDAQRAAFAATTGPGAPLIELQREGFKGLFDSQPNALWYLRLSTPFNAPWQSSRTGGLRVQVNAWMAPERRARLLDDAATVGYRWLELAAENERLDVLRSRVQRVDRALTIQRRRFELGEVSGSDVTQLELERLIDLARVHEAEARTLALAGALRSLTGAEFSAPRPGDLEELLETTGTLPELATLVTAVEGSAQVLAARERAAAEARWGDLIDRTAWGRPRFALELEHAPSVGGAPAFTGWGFLLSVPLPFGSAGSEQQIEARARARTLEAEARRLQLDLQRQLTEAHAVESAATSVLTELSAALDRAASIEFSLAEQFRLGAVSYLVYIDGLTRLDEVRLQAVASRLRLLSARLRGASVLDAPTIFPLPVTARQETSS
jgi:hypothetical protein